jgi:internalin A
LSLINYFDIYGRHMEFDRSKALHLSRYLHDLGVFLHFQDDPLLARTVILQNPWATEAVFRILDDEIVKTHLGRFNSADCKRLWRDSVYVDMHPELLALMQRFELCYLLADSQPQTWLAPQLLPPAKPIALTNWREPEDLVLRYRYDFMPKGIISRLMVRLHRFVRNPEMAWVTGVLFERDDTTLLVELLASGNEIELRARGPERRALLSVIAADLDALNDSVQGLPDKVDKRIPCNCKKCRAVSVPEFFVQKNLLKRKEDNRLKVECPDSYEDVDVLELLDGLSVEKLPGWAKQKGPAALYRTIRIFLASSAELREDRDAFDLYFRQQNDQFLEEGFYLEIVRWENFLDAMSETRLEDEYNKAVGACDIFVSLFFTKTGKFTEEEFDTAHRLLKHTGKPRIYTFFKNAEIKTGCAREEDLTSLWKFQKKLASLGHFHTTYDNIEHLKRQFRDQLKKLLGEYD